MSDDSMVNMLQKCIEENLFAIPAGMVNPELVKLYESGHYGSDLVHVCLDNTWVLMPAYVPGITGPRMKSVDKYSIAHNVAGAEDVPITNED